MEDKAYNSIFQDILQKVLQLSENPREFSAYLAQQIRELIGTKTVLIAVKTESEKPEILSVYPTRREEWCNQPDMFGLMEKSFQILQTQFWGVETENLSFKDLLISLEIRNTIAIPVIVADKLVGSILLLDIMDLHGINSVITLLEKLSGVFGLVIKNSLIYTNLENLVEKRTDELSKRNKEILESEEKFRSSFEHAAIGKSITTIDGQLNANRAYCNMLGYTVDELSKLNWREITHKDDIDENENIVKAILNGKKDYARWEKRFIHKNESIVWVDITTTLLRDESGLPLYFITEVVDITEKKNAELELQAHAKRLNSIVNVLQNSTTSIQNYLDYVLDQAIEMTDSKIGYLYHYNEDKMEFVLNSWSKGVMDACKIMEKQTVYQLKKTGLWGEAVRQRKPIVDNDFKAPHSLKTGFPDGHAPLHKFLTIPVFRKERIVAVIGVANKDTDYNDFDLKQLTVLMDIVWNELEKKASETALSESEEKFKKAFMTSPDAINITRVSDGMYVSVSEGFTNMLGYTEEETIGKTSVEMNIWDDLEDRDKLVKGLKENGTFKNLLAQFKKKNGGTIYGLISANVIELNGEKHLISITRDVTDKTKTELALRESKAKLDAALASTTDAIFITDKEGNYIQYNEAFLKFQRLSRTDECPENFESFSNVIQVYYANGEIAPTEMWAIPRALRGESVTNFEYKLRRKDTGETWVGSYSFSPMRDDKGEIVGSVVVARDVTELKKTEQNLIESEFRFRNAFMNAPFPIMLHADNGAVELVNDEWTKVTGYNFEDISTIDLWTEKAYGVNKALVQEDIQRMYSITEKVEEGEYIITTKSGEPKNWYFSSTPLGKTPDGRRLVMSMALDITERKLAEQTILENQEKWESLFNNNPNAVAIYQAVDEGNDFIFTDFNLKAQKTDNIQHDEVVGKSIRQVFPGSVELGFMDVFKKVWLTGNTEFINSSFYKDNRIEGWRENIIYKLKTGEIVAIYSDVTERKKAEIALQQSEKKLSTLFNSMTEMVVIHEMIFNEEGKAVDYKILECNEAFTKITGIKSLDAIGKLATEVYQSQKAPYLEEYAGVVTTGLSKEYNTYYLPMDKHFLISAVSMGANLFATITSDISAIQQVKEVTLAKNKELENYLYVASHDLRSPLVNIQGFSQRLQEQTRNLKEIVSESNMDIDLKRSLSKIANDSIPKSLEFILSNTTKMDILIKGLLQISRIGRVEMHIKKVDMNKLLKTIVSHVGFEISEINAQVGVEDLMDCYGDENQLNQLFSNIISNALKYRDEKRQLVIQLSSQLNYNRVVYCIEDNGIGIAEKNLEKIWNVFYRVDSSKPDSGEGIGLSLVQKIAEKHKGKISVESKEGVGTKFYIELQKHKFDE